MLSRMQNSWSLVKASAGVLKQDPELLVFPVLSGITLVLVCSSFFGVGVLTGLQEAVLADGGESGGVLGGLVAAAFYVVTYTVMFYFNAAMVGAALIRLDGGDPTIADGFRIASQRMGTILGYAVLAATVGMIIRTIAERAGIVGRILTGLFGTAWSVATYLAIPVLVTRDVDPLEAVKESASLFRKTWGEQMVGNAGISLVFLPIFLAIAVLGFGSAAALAGIATPLAVLAGLSTVGALILAGLVSSALSTIYSAALYRYAVSGQAPVGFDNAVFERAFRSKRRR